MTTYAGTYVPARIITSAPSAYRRRRPATSRPAAPATPIGLQRRMRALAWMGWELADIAAHSGVYEPHVLAARLGLGASSPDEARLLVETYDELCMRFGPSDQARRYAVDHGWNPPLAWDEPDDADSPHNIDDPDAWPAVTAPRAARPPADWYDHAAVQRHLDGDPPRQLTSAERRAYGERMLNRGASLYEVQTALGVHWNVVKRLGLVDLARKVRAAS